jgi:predicted heme/steroid binding protein/uncharacterized membrane protein
MKDKEIDAETLSASDGREGNPVYIVHNGRIIDVSGSALWKGGLHMQRHRAGRDLTVDIEAAPHGLEVLDRYPQIGVLKKESVPQKPMPEFLSKLLSRYPILRRHPHPIAVHFPIALMVCATLFTLLYLITGVRTFETTSLHCVGAGILFAPLAMITGFFTWWLNYMARPVRQVAIKIWLSSIMLIIGIIVFLWRIFDAGILENFGGESVIYLILVLALGPLATATGYYGGTLTFPIEGNKS